MDRKGSRKTKRSGRQDRRKKQRPLNKVEMQKDHTSESTSAKKLKQDDVDDDYSVNPMIGYSILNFLTVLTALSSYVKCKDCDGDVQFEEAKCRGLGFALVVNCKTCESKFINSCPLIGNAYEINRKFIFAMRLLGIGLHGAEMFTAFLDLPRPIFQSFYDTIVSRILDATKFVAQSIMKKSLQEEITLTEEAKGQHNGGLTVSGDGTWMKRGFTSLFGVASLIGFHTNKVIDVEVKSAYCHACKLHENDDPDDMEHQLWKLDHKEKCSINHEGASGKMEVDAIREMFERSEQLYGVRYTYYVGDGDSKTFKMVLDSKPYGDTPIIKKRVC